MINFREKTAIQPFCFFPATIETLNSFPQLIEYLCSECIFYTMFVLSCSLCVFEINECSELNNMVPLRPDAMVMTPIALGAGGQKPSAPLAAMDVMEQKNWWQLEEVTLTLALWLFLFSVFFLLLILMKSIS